MERFENFLKNKLVDTTGDVWDNLPKEVQNLVDETLKNVANNNVRSHSDVMADIRKQYCFIK